MYSTGNSNRIETVLVQGLERYIPPFVEAGVTTVPGLYVVAVDGGLAAFRVTGRGDQNRIMRVCRAWMSRSGFEIPHGDYAGMS